MNDDSGDVSEIPAAVVTGRRVALALLLLATLATAVLVLVLLDAWATRPPTL
ncbi:hypothetical protein [Actinokineospora cianjurensis]|uniref:Uncharacterized protein n=1 Tax=Actinokineospora cianjurensis TaxID=585224 RepID=A0A421AVS9_9PSEU|nr:hypothetical protein [Actinokineospora cianjurensis]RLK54185.1 hypothetical protein CLV68_6188 [Actinokineospora cianjurensis]